MGLPNATTLRKILDVADLVPPVLVKNGTTTIEVANPVWTYHGYLGYSGFIGKYGAVKGFEDFVMKAQLVNYEQYRSLQEGYNAKMWNWYSGMLVWKGQNPWTALRGQFYDYFLDQNAGFYGYKHAAQPLHVQLNLVDTTICVINTLAKERRDLIVRSVVYDIHGQRLSGSTLTLTVAPNSVTDTLKLLFPPVEGSMYFVRLTLASSSTNAIIDENTYWLSRNNDNYEELNKLTESEVTVIVNRPSETRATAEIRNTGKETAFFLRGSIVGSNRRRTDITCLS